MLVQFDNGVTPSDRIVAGARDGANSTYFFLKSSSSTNHHYYGWGDITAGWGTGLAAGNMALTGSLCYLNSVYDGNTESMWTLCSVPIWIGGANNTGALYQPFSGHVTAVAIYDNVITEGQVGAIYNEMSGALTQVEYNTAISFGGSTASAKVYVQEGKAFVQSVNVGNTATYQLEAYAYTDGSAVTDANAELYYNGSSITTTYEDAGSGWYKLSGEVTGADASRDYGVEVKSGETVYIDDASLYKYEDTGTLESAVYDTSQSSDWGVIDWTAGGGGSLAVKVRSSNSPTMSGATSWASCDYVSSGVDISGSNCVTDGDQYIQYYVEFTSGSTPVLEEISISFDVLAAGDDIQDDLTGTGQMIIPVIITGAASIYTGILTGREVKKRSQLKTQ
jgi:hypothetical protein